MLKSWGSRQHKLCHQKPPIPIQLESIYKVCSIVQLTITRPLNKCKNLLSQAMSRLKSMLSLIIFLLCWSLKTCSNLPMNIWEYLTHFESNLLSRDCFCFLLTYFLQATKHKCFLITMSSSLGMENVILGAETCMPMPMQATTSAGVTNLLALIGRPKSVMKLLVKLKAASTLSGTPCRSNHRNN